VEFLRSTRNWLVATTFATLFLAAVIPAAIYAAVFAFALPELGPLGISWTTWAFLFLFTAAIVQASFATRNRSWRPLLNWFLGIWLAYWVWGLFINSFGYDRSSVFVLLRDNTHPAMWTFPLVILLIWWLKPSGLAIRRGLDIAILTIFAIIGVRILIEPFLPTSLDPFRWTVGWGWLASPFENPPAAQGNPPTHHADWWLLWNYSIYGAAVRPSFIVEHANTLGFVAAFLFVYGLTRGKRLGLLFTVLAFLLLLSSTSRTALAAATASALLIAYVWCWRTLTSHRRRKGLLIAGALALTLAAATLFVRRPSLTGRTSQWESAIGNIDWAVVSGMGGEAWVQNVVAMSPTIGSQFHNSFLSGLAWGGLVGLVLLIALWVLGFVLAFRPVKAGNLASLALLTTCLVLSMTESTFAYRYWSMGNALLLAAVLLSQWQPPSRSKDLPTAPGAQIEGLQGAPVRRPR
jgi:hypothetical protein